MKIKRLGERKVSIEELVLGEDVLARRELERVKAMADTFKRVGCLQRPWVRQSTMEPVLGRDRIAAAMVAGWTKLDVTLVEGSDQEMKEVSLIEDGHRRHSSKEKNDALKELVDIYEEKFDAEARRDKALRAPKEKGKRGPQKSPRRKALEHVAKETGRSPDALRQALREPAAPEKVECSILTLGIDLNDDFKQEMNIIRNLTGRIKNHIQAAETGITELVKAKTSVPSGPLARLREELSHLLRDVSLIEPYAVCPFCKGHDPYQQACAACLKTGWVSKSVYEDAPKGLRNDQVKYVMSAGRMIRLELEVPPVDPQPPDEEDEEEVRF